MVGDGIARELDAIGLEEHGRLGGCQSTGVRRQRVADGLAVGIVRDDVPIDELAAYCLHALGAAGDLPSKSAVRRLVSVVLAGLKP